MLLLLLSMSTAGAFVLGTISTGDATGNSSGDIDDDDSTAATDGDEPEEHVDDVLPLLNSHRCFGVAVAVPFFVLC